MSTSRPDAPEDGALLPPPVTDTIVAAATPPGRAGLAVLRLSGPRAHEIARHVFRPRRGTALPPRRCVTGRVLLDDGTPDEATCVLFRGPASFTGEDVAELGVHGNPWVLRSVTSRAVRAGARPAGAGEFAYRAFLAGRLDVTQAEALDALIRAASPAAASVAARVLGGSLGGDAAKLQALILDALAELEAAVDFQDDTVGQRRIDEALARLARAAAQWHRASGRAPIALEGLRVALAGPVNVGKSSLFNALLASERAIVTDEPGTTRDVLEGHLVLGGVGITLLDTAGERQATSAAEREGIRRSSVVRESASVVLEVHDVTQHVPTASENPDVLVVANKVDLLETRPPTGPGVHAVSARRGDGLEGLVDALTSRAEAAAVTEGPALIGERQLALAAAVAGHAEDARRARREGWSEELVAEPLRSALDDLAALCGHHDVEDIYARVFRRFCVGK